MRVLIILMVLVLVGCTSKYTHDAEVTESKPTLSVSEKERWNLMVGKWYGSNPTKSGGVRQFITERYQDGSYRDIFKVTDAQGNSSESSEVGYWGISGLISFAIFRGWLNQGIIEPSDPTDPYNYDAYHIISLNSEEYEYSHVTTGNRFRVKKVDPDFVFPN